MASDEIIAANTKALQALINALNKEKVEAGEAVPILDVSNKTAKELEDEIRAQTDLENILKRKQELERVSQARQKVINEIQKELSEGASEQTKELKKQLELLKKQEAEYQRQKSGMSDLLKLGKDLKEDFKAVKQSVLDVLSALRESYRLFEDIDTTVFSLESIKKGGYELDKLNNQLQRTTGIVGNTENRIRSFVDSTEGLAMSAQEVVRNFGTLQQSVSDFGRLTPKIQDQLVKTTFLLERTGIASQTSAELFQISSKTLGNQGESATKLADDMRILAENIGESPQKMAQSFATAAPRLASYGQNMEKVFKDLAIQSKATGVEINKLLGIAEGFDTFEGAARKTAQLNAMFGTQLNSVQLLNMEEGERIKLIKDQLALTGKNIDTLGKFEVKSIADILGTDAEAVRRIFRDTQDLEEEINKAAQRPGTDLRTRAQTLTDEDAKRIVAAQRDQLFAGQKYLGVIEETVRYQSQNTEYIKEQAEELKDAVDYYKAIQKTAGGFQFLDPSSVGQLEGIISAIGTALKPLGALAGVLGTLATLNIARKLGLTTKIAGFAQKGFDAVKGFFTGGGTGGGGIPPGSGGGGTPTATPTPGGGTPTATPRAGGAPTGAPKVKLPPFPPGGPQAAAEAAKLAEASKISRFAQAKNLIKGGGQFLGPALAAFGVGFGAKEMMDAKNITEKGAGAANIGAALASLTGVGTIFSGLRFLGKMTGEDRFDTDKLYADMLFKIIHGNTGSEAFEATPLFGIPTPQPPRPVTTPSGAQSAATDVNVNSEITVKVELEDNNGVIEGKALATAKQVVTENNENIAKASNPSNFASQAFQPGIGLG